MISAGQRTSSYLYPNAARNHSDAETLSSQHSFSALQQPNSSCNKCFREEASYRTRQMKHAGTFKDDNPQKAPQFVESNTQRNKMAPKIKLLPLLCVFLKIKTQVFENVQASILTQAELLPVLLQTFFGHETGWANHSATYTLLYRRNGFTTQQLVHQLTIF